ncbi:hypothetical protein [Saliphagus infecundisoli]|uniref:Uncharacterized protein n=1 Tax=Saliphagus infecundisoli TaxID=1849069 RepID=A0ABD5QL58_9EURY|nr:hypothetical protein [Saliphagus infecundisoli]
MKRRALLVAGVGVLGGCLQNGAENTQGSDGTGQGEDENRTSQETESNGTDDESNSNATDQSDTSNGTNQDNVSNGTTEEPESNVTDQGNTSNGTGQDDPTNRSDHTTESTETEQTDTSNGTTQDNATNGSAQEEDGNGTDQDDHNRESRTYEVEAETSPESPIHHEFDVTQPDIHSPDSPLTLTVSISNTTDETITYADERSIVGSYLTSREFRLVPEGKHEYDFDEEKRAWHATKAIGYGDTIMSGELEPNGTRSQNIVLIRDLLEEFPDRIPSEFEFATEFGAEEKEGEDTMVPDLEYQLAFDITSVS